MVKYGCIAGSSNGRTTDSGSVYLRSNRSPAALLYSLLALLLLIDATVILLCMVGQHFFSNTKTIAVVGLSDKPDRYSYQVASYLQSQGYKIIPVNPNITEVLGEKAYPNLLTIPKDITIDVVDIFRRSEDVLPHVKEAVERGDAKTIWMQEGVINTKAEALAKSRGLDVVMNACLMKTHKAAITH